MGAQTAAAELGERIYWNASTREDDIDGQIALVDRVRSGRYRGLVLAPDHSQALITPVRRALAGGLPIVIVGSSLPIPPSDNLAYVLNDDTEGGRLAAQRVAGLIHGRGEVALLGIDQDIDGITVRARSFQRSLAVYAPLAHIVVRRLGTLNFGHEQEIAEEVLRENPNLDVIVALTSPSTRGAISTIQSHPTEHLVKVIGFDPDSIPFELPSLDSVIVQDTRAMGDRAVRLIHSRLQGHQFASQAELEPTLVTRENVGNPQMQEMIYTRWRPDAANLKRSTTP